MKIPTHPPHAAETCDHAPCIRLRNAVWTYHDLLANVQATDPEKRRLVMDGTLDKAWDEMIRALAAFGWPAERGPAS